MNGRSFSWIEGVTMVCAVLVVAGFQMSNTAKPLVTHEWPALVELIVASLILGVAFAGPFVLVAQFLVRRRSSAISFGEWLWIVPLALYVTGVISTNIAITVSDWAAYSAACLCMHLQYTASTVGIVAFFTSSNIRCRWSDLVAGRTHQTFSNFDAPARIWARNSRSRAAALRLRAMLSLRGFCLSRLKASFRSTAKLAALCRS